MNLSQEKFAAKAEIGEQGSISELERGEGNPTYKTIAGAAKALGLELPVLFSEIGVPPEVVNAPDDKVWDDEEIRSLSKTYLPRARPS